MEAVVFCGIQASGKSTFYRERFFDTHVRISLDLLRTRHRERLLLAACLEARQRFVVDNTNPTVEDRARYIEPARAAGFRVLGCYFVSDPQAAFARNRLRTGRAAVPAAGLFGTYKRLQPPTLEEGFECIDRIELHDTGYVVTPWRPAPPAGVAPRAVP